MATNKIIIRYDKTSKCMEIYDQENAQHFEAHEVEEMLGYGFTVDHEEESITLTVPEQYAVQMLNPHKDNYDVLAICPANTINYVFEAVWKKSPNDTIRVLRNSNLSVYAKYTPQEGAVVGLTDDDD